MYLGRGLPREKKAAHGVARHRERPTTGATPMAPAILAYRRRVPTRYTSSARTPDPAQFTQRLGSPPGEHVARIAGID